MAGTLDWELPGDKPGIGGGVMSVTPDSAAALMELIFSQGKESKQLNNQKDTG